MNPKNDGALRVACPRCGALAEFRCSNGPRLVRPHKERLVVVELADIDLLVEEWMNYIYDNNDLLQVLSAVELAPALVLTALDAKRMAAFCQVWKGQERQSALGVGSSDDFSCSSMTSPCAR